MHDDGFNGSLIREAEQVFDRLPAVGGAPDDGSEGAEAEAGL
jgi:hypothetical protein